MAYTGSVFGEASGPPIYSHVSCEGWENDIKDCRKIQYENVTCHYYTIAGIMCSNSMMPINWLHQYHTFYII